MPPPRRRLPAPAWLALAACLCLLGAPEAVKAAVKAGSYDPHTDAHGGSLLTPMRGRLLRRTFYWEIPHDPVGVLFMAHGCVHDAADFWPHSKACPQCSGLPEEVAHTKQALRRGYAVLAVDSGNRDPANRCFSYPGDKWSVKYILENWTRQYNLQTLPIFGLGISAGASFVLKLPKITRLNGIVSEVLGTTYEKFPVDSPTYPPTMFIEMERDTSMAERISASMQKLAEFGVPNERIVVDPRPVTPYFFSDRSEYIEPELSRRIVAGLRRIGMLDAQGYVTVDPRYTTKPWKEQLGAVLGRNGLGQETGEFNGQASDWALIGEQMNVAFAMHEIISDHLTASLAWLESGGSADIGQLERRLKASRQPAKLVAARDPAPELQDDEALKQATEQVERQLATTLSDRANWGDMYAKYAAYLQANPASNLTFPEWRALPEAGRLGYKTPQDAKREAAGARDAARRDALPGQPDPGAPLGTAPQHTAL